MENISVLIADDNKELTLMIKEYLNSYHFNVKETFNQGIDLLNYLKTDSADLLILDICMPVYDGFNILDELNNSNVYKKPTKIILLSALSSEEVISRASKNGIDYFLIKPVKLSNLLSTINNLFNLESIDKKIDRLLNNYSIKENLSGYKYLHYAIKACYNNPLLINSITKELYPLIADKFYSTHDRVERAIRNAIEQAYLDNELSLIFDKKPTNTKFIKYMLTKLE